jgi:hypothetical protein
MPAARLEQILRRAGIAERRSGGGRGDVFSELVLILTERGEVYDQDGTPLAQFRVVRDYPSLRERLRTDAEELVGLDDRVLLRVTRRRWTVTTTAADGSEVGVIKFEQGRRREGTHNLHMIEVDGEIVGSIRFVRRSGYVVFGKDDVQVGRITHHLPSFIRRRPECNVIEIDEAMPGTLRRLMPAASKGVFHMNIPPA